MKKITITEEIKKIKRLYNFKKGDTMLSEQRHEKKTYLDVKNHLGDRDLGRACFTKALELVKTDGEEWEVESYQSEYAENFEV